MEGTVFHGSEGKHGPGGFSWGKQWQIGNAQDSGWLPPTKAGWKVKDTDAKSGVVNSSSSQHLEHCLGANHNEGTRICKLIQRPRIPF